MLVLGLHHSVYLQDSLLRKFRQLQILGPMIAEGFVSGHFRSLRCCQGTAPTRSFNGYFELGEKNVRLTYGTGFAFLCFMNDHRLAVYSRLMTSIST